jgi:hypothetical protein
VREHPAEVPKAGRTALQTVVILIAALAVLAALLWLVVPFAS